MAERSSYSWTQIALHWTIAVLIVVNYLVSEGMEQAFDGAMEGKAVTGWTPVIHVYVGLAVLALVLVRLAIRLTQGAPAAMDTGHRLLDRAGGISHFVLYLLMVAVPVLGAITWYGGVDATAELHVLAMNAMMLIVLVHAAAALMHQFVLRDGLLMRMVRGQ